MISIEEAIAIVSQHAERLAPIEVRRQQALGAVLAAPVSGDIDSPPYDKSLVDGYAVIAADVQRKTRPLRVLETIAAGVIPKLEVTRGTTSRIMTGAPMPEGADAVVMHEQTDAAPVSHFMDPTSSAMDPDVTLCTTQVTVGQNVLRQGTSFKAGELLLPIGKLVRPVEAGLLADVGCPKVSVYRRPRVAIASTGNELVPAEQFPAAGQIRSSNESLLAALVAASRGIPTCLGIAADDRTALSAVIRQGLQHDVLILSGGVSAGDLDLVPPTLQSLGVEQVFHKVNLRPGKPMWFGVWSDSGRKVLVFGLPGNPVSVLVCFHLLVRIALLCMGGESHAAWPWQIVGLSEDHHNRSGRPTYFPARISREEDAEYGGHPRAHLLPWHGSADLCCLRDAHGFVFLPADQTDFPAGSLLRFYFLDDSCHPAPP